MKLDPYSAISNFTNSELDEAIDEVLYKETEIEIVANVISFPPQYTTDPFTIHGAEETLTADQFVVYLSTLYKILYRNIDDKEERDFVSSVNGIYPDNGDELFFKGMWAMWRSPIRFRAEALYLTLTNTEM